MRLARLLDQQCPQHDGARAGGKTRRDVGRRSHPAAGLHRDVDRSADRAQCRGVLAAAECGVEIDDMERLRAGLDERTCAGDRIDIVARLAPRVAALEPHGVTAAQIDRRIEQQPAAHPAAIARKLSISRPPAVRLFSG